MYMSVPQPMNTLARAKDTDKGKKGLRLAMIMKGAAWGSSLKDKASLGVLTSTPSVKMMLELKAGMVKAPKYLMPSPVKIWAPALNQTGSCKDTTHSLTIATWSAEHHAWAMYVQNDAIIIIIIIIKTLSSSWWARYVQDKSCLSRAACLVHPYKAY